RVDLDTETLELGVVVGQVTELGRAHEGEVGRVEEHDRPLAAEVLVGDLDELAVVEGRGLEGLDLGVEKSHADGSSGCEGSLTHRDSRSDRAVTIVTVD